eukprot:2194079-Amphidinium_carterae.1
MARKEHQAALFKSLAECLAGLGGRRRLICVFKTCAGQWPLPSSIHSVARGYSQGVPDNKADLLFCPILCIQVLQVGGLKHTSDSKSSAHVAAEA